MDTPKKKTRTKPQEILQKRGGAEVSVRGPESLL